MVNRVTAKEIFVPQKLRNLVRTQKTDSGTRLVGKKIEEPICSHRPGEEYTQIGGERTLAECELCGAVLQID